MDSGDFVKTWINVITWCRAIKPKGSYNHSQNASRTWQLANRSAGLTGSPPLKATFLFHQRSLSAQHGGSESGKRMNPVVSNCHLPGCETEVNCCLNCGSFICCGLAWFGGSSFAELTCRFRPDGAASTI